MCRNVSQCLARPPEDIARIAEQQTCMRGVRTDGNRPLLCVSTKIEKEKREHAKQHGMIRTEITGAEIAEEMEKERRLFQLQMCEVGCKMKL